MVEMALEDVIVRVDREDASSLVWDSRIVVLREPGGDRRLPIWIGPGEGPVSDTGRVECGHVPEP